MTYESFSEVYDLFMDNVPYKEWCDRLCSILEQYGIRDGLIVDLGCGTGTMTELLAERGYDMIGIDCSAEMLDQAILKRDRSGKDILYLQQDMRGFELYGTVRAVICICDSLNYVLEEEEVETVFSLVNNYLDPGGIFLFDFNTVCRYRDEMGEMVVAENRDTAGFIWENEYEEDTMLNYSDLTLFIQEEGDLFRRFTEEHVQRAYTEECIRKNLEKAGMCVKGFFDGYSEHVSDAGSGRILAVAQKKRKFASHDRQIDEKLK